MHFICTSSFVIQIQKELHTRNVGLCEQRKKSSPFFKNKKERKKNTKINKILCSNFHDVKDNRTAHST